MASVGGTFSKTTRSSWIVKVTWDPAWSPKAVRTALGKVTCPFRVTVAMLRPLDIMVCRTWYDVKRLALMALPRSYLRQPADPRRILALGAKLGYLVGKPMCRPRHPTRVAVRTGQWGG